jgi:predicted nucleotidyltransferase
MDLTELLATKRQAILELAERNGVTTIRVFGSASRGDSSADSDLGHRFSQTGVNFLGWGRVF